MKRRGSRARDPSTEPRRTRVLGPRRVNSATGGDAPRWWDCIDDLERSLSLVTECVAARQTDPLGALEAVCAEHTAVLTRHSWVLVLLLETVAGANSFLKRRMVRMVAGQCSGIVLLLVQARQRGLVAPALGVQVAADTLLTRLQNLALRMRLGDPGDLSERASQSSLLETGR